MEFIQKTKLIFSKMRLIKRNLFFSMILIPFSFNGGVNAKMAQGKITLRVLYKQYTAGDSIKLKLNDELTYDKTGISFLPKYIEGKFIVFEVPVNDICGYFSIQAKRKLSNFGEMDLISNAFWEIGDSLLIKINHRETIAGVYADVEYAGIGSDKYSLVEKMSKIRMVEMDQPVLFTGNILSEPLQKGNPTFSLRLSFLEENRYRLTALSYGVIKANLMEDLLSANMLMVRTYYRENVKKMNNVDRLKFIKKFKELFFPIQFYGIKDEYLSRSNDFLYYLNTLFGLDALMNKGRNDPDYIYQDILNFSPGKFTLQPLLIMNFIKSGNSNNLDNLYSKAEKFMLTSNAKRELEDLRITSLEIIPDYTFKDINGKTIKISDFKNKIILIDIWFWGCGGCALYYKDVLSRLEKEKFINKDVIILSISDDRSLENWKKGMNAGIYTGEHAVNLYAGNEIGYKHPILSRYDIRLLPTPILIDRSGKIVNFKTPDLFNFESLLKEIYKLL